MALTRLKRVLRRAAEAAVAFAVLFFWIGFLVYTSVEWIDRDVLDGLRGKPKPEVIKTLGEPTRVWMYRGMDGNLHERLYYSRKWGLPLEYELIFDAEGNLSVWCYDNGL